MDTIGKLILDKFLKLLGSPWGFLGFLFLLLGIIFLFLSLVYEIKTPWFTFSEESINNFVKDRGLSKRLGLFALAVGTAFVLPLIIYSSDPNPNAVPTLPSSKSNEPKTNVNLVAKFLSIEFTDEVNSVRTDGKVIVSGDDNDKVRVWGFKDGVEKRLSLLNKNGHTANVLAVAISQDGKFIASAGKDNTIKVWDSDTGELLYTLRDHRGWVSSIAISSNNLLVSGSYDKTVKIWNLSNGELLQTYVAHDDIVLAVAISLDGKVAVSGSKDKSIIIWDLEKGKWLKEPLREHSGSVWALDIRDNLFVSGSEDGSVKIWRIDENKSILTLEDPQNKDSSKKCFYIDHDINAVVLSPDKQIVVSGGDDKSIKLWDINTGKLLTSIRGHDREVWSVTFSPNGEDLISSGADYTMRLWKVQRLVSSG
ncbi:MAG: WD40 repeat domain-containing protein [Hydrococcus sp. Prado102]|jgi:WD40 repeat protein|nr:WD40 repeat domain-containing protein [Hydrococcus sp. Prado102]